MKVDRDGYIMIIKRDHPFHDSIGYVREHRLVWEEYNNAILLPWANIHHKNGITNDNRIENLEAMMNSHHTRIHVKKDMSNRRCLECGSSKTFIDNMGWPKWFVYPDGYFCARCNKRLKRRLKIYKN